MNQKTCPICGSPNPYEAFACVRCGNAFSATPYVDAIANPAPAAWAPPQPPSGYAPGYAPYAPAPAASADDDHLRWLSIAFYCVGAFVALVSCIPFIHVAIGIGLLATSATGGGDAPPAFAGVLFIVLGAFFILFGWTIAACTVSAGRYLKQRRRRMFCQIVAGILCLWMPIGTALGILTLIVLARPSVKAKFAA